MQPCALANSSGGVLGCYQCALEVLVVNGREQQCSVNMQDSDALGVGELLAIGVELG